jgi:hypothetical protein
MRCVARGPQRDARKRADDARETADAPALAHRRGPSTTAHDHRRRSLPWREPVPLDRRGTDLGVRRLGFLPHGRPSGTGATGTTSSDPVAATRARRAWDTPPLLSNAARWPDSRGSTSSAFTAQPLWLANEERLIRPHEPNQQPRTPPDLRRRRRHGRRLRRTTQHRHPPRPRPRTLQHPPQSGRLPPPADRQLIRGGLLAYLLRTRRDRGQRGPLGCVLPPDPTRTHVRTRRAPQAAPPRRRRNQHPPPALPRAPTPRRLRHLHATYASHLLHAAKPDRTFYHAIIQAEGVAPNHALFIDDIEKNVDGARQAGLQALHYTDTQTLTDALEHLLPPRE